MIQNIQIEDSRGFPGMSDKKTIDAALLKNLVPLNALTPEHQAEIASQTALRVAMAKGIVSSAPY